MTWSQYSSDRIPFPTPYRTRDIYYPTLYPDHNLYHPYERHLRRRRSSRSHNESTEKCPAVLKDKSITDRAGDLGWTLAYATAWAFRNLVGNQIEVVDAIDRVRELGEVTQDTPFIIFDYLSRALFGGKLRGMVHLSWKSLASFSPGITSAPGVVPGISRVCIELNSTPFEDGEAEIDNLLDALIHQMIHAYFLIACGAQPKGSKQDGRLLDGLHFGVILFTIRDLSINCRYRRPLNLIFYASTRRRKAAGQSRRMLPNDGLMFVEIDSRGLAAADAPADGQSHCSFDNRKVRYAQLKNWQIESYSAALDLDMESKGDVIYDLNVDNAFVPLDRLKAPPSTTYIELIWEDKRVMVKRELALKYKSIMTPLEKEHKMELKVPECSQYVFRHIYDFFMKGSYAMGLELSMQDSSTYEHSRGPPVLTNRGSKQPESTTGVVVQLQVFKVAEAMKFEELQKYILSVIWDLPVTDDDPISILQQLYNEHDNSGPIHAELHKWGREFLARVEGYAPNVHSAYNPSSAGMSNLQKIWAWHGSRFNSLYHCNMALKDDCKHATYALNAGSGMGGLGRGPIAQPSLGPIGRGNIDSMQIRGPPWARSMNDLPMLPSPYGALPLPACTPIGTPFNDMAIGLGKHRQTTRPFSLPWQSSIQALDLDDGYQHYGRDGRQKVYNPWTGDIYVRRPRVFYDNNIDFI
ncbi:hypothetical protein BAUCODRAFT_408506 [Baudoinia panamericana UAMH 10762]|uniref:SprT-like domain-containing protein n=1 Tax=Baudoinia panamericana (strain UAMH 10762) TaxID=717646 RepID=M2NG24_BAUPA|nr:uncharacterized protein BAUCODRAFT_408506 [Baudoinia panamericana UAMH 10762]EMC97940.1 hypothetical protein BAUCODRAFT_408506 [Baudoinia panamericana UAMH 10762]